MEREGKRREATFSTNQVKELEVKLLEIDFNKQHTGGLRRVGTDEGKGKGG